MKYLFEPKLAPLFTAVFLVTLLTSISSVKAEKETNNDSKAYFAGGCFWCMEQALEKIDGVSDVISGYMGGSAQNSTYRKVAAGLTKHYEAVEVIYDPEKVSYRDLLAAFWRNVDPHDPNGQFCDKGPQYRAAIFAQNAQEQAAAKSSLHAIQEANILSQPIITEIIEASPFYPAEDYHQNYYKTNSVRYGFYKTLCRRTERLQNVWENHDLRKIIGD